MIISISNKIKNTKKFQIKNKNKIKKNDLMDNTKMEIIR